MENQPSDSIDKELSIPSEVVLVDPRFGQPGRIDLLLGAEVYSRLVRPGLIELGTDKPILQETTLGWIAYGTLRRRLPAAMAENITTRTREDPLPALENLWKLVTFNTEVPAMIVQERLCEEHFLMVRGPFAENPRVLGTTSALARTGSGNARRIRELYG